MTEAIAFDTHRFVKRLTESGFTEKQAETLAEEHVALLNSNLATKGDIESSRQETKADIAKVEAGMDALRQETKAGIEALRHETHATIESVKADLVKWLFGGMRHGATWMRGVRALGLKAFGHAVMEGMMELSEGRCGPAERGVAIVFPISVTP